MPAGPADHAVGRDPGAWYVPSDGLRKKPVQPSALLRVELVDVIHGDELYFCAVRKVRRLVQSEASVPDPCTEHHGIEV
jgi:hypothetical protein